LPHLTGSSETLVSARRGTQMARVLYSDSVVTHFSLHSATSSGLSAVVSRFLAVVVAVRPLFRLFRFSRASRTRRASGIRVESLESVLIVASLPQIHHFLNDAARHEHCADFEASDAAVFRRSVGGGESGAFSRCSTACLPPLTVERWTGWQMVSCEPAEGDGDSSPFVFALFRRLPLSSRFPPSSSSSTSSRPLRHH
jgi:hypothetical protein